MPNQQSLIPVYERGAFSYLELFGILLAVLQLNSVVGNNTTEHSQAAAITELCC